MPHGDSPAAGGVAVMKIVNVVLVVGLYRPGVSGGFIRWKDEDYG